MANSPACRAARRQPLPTPTGGQGRGAATTIDAYLKGIAALVSLAYAAVLLLAGPRRRPNQALAVFFLLIAGNQAIETVRGSLPTAGPGTVTALYRAAHLLSSLDPLALYWFAALVPASNALRRPRAVVPVAAASLALALCSIWVVPPETRGPWTYLEMVDDLFTLAVYGTVLAHFLRLLAARQGELRLLYVALCIATLTLPFRLASAIVHDLTHQGLLGTRLANAGTLVLAPLALAAGGMALLAWRSRAAVAGNRKLVWGGAAAGIALGLPLGLLDLVNLQQSVPQLSRQILDYVWLGGASLRWILFGWLVSFTLLRDGLLDMTPTARRRAARALLGLFVFVAVAALLPFAHAVLGAGTPSFSPTDLLVLAAAVVASQWFRTLLDRLSRRLYGIPLAGDAAVAEAYGLGVADQVAKGAPLAGNPALLRLRQDLGIGERTARVVERMAVAVGASELAPGHVVAGRYRVLDELSERVFVAEDQLLLRSVVVKRVGTQAGLPAEARAASGLQHPNVVTLHDVVRHGHAWLLVTEHVAGGSLADRLAAGTPAMPEAVRILDGVLAGLAAIHRHGIVHCDLKPANILLQPDGVPKIADFGIAHRPGGTQALGPQAGTLGFVAPEVLAGAPPTVASDLYAAGVVMKLLFPAPSPALQRVMSRALTANPDRRWASADRMLAGFQAAVAKQG